MLQKKDRYYFLLLMAIIIPLEIHAADLAFETLGASASGFYFVLIFFNLFPIHFFCSGNRKVAISIAAVLALLIVPQQLYLGHKHTKLQEEASNIVSYVYEYKLKHGIKITFQLHHLHTKGYSSRNR